MTINGKRNFVYNGKKYRVQDACKEFGFDLGDKKYFVTVMNENGIYVAVYNRLGYEIDWFRTIKDAQRYVRDNDFLFDTL